MAIIRRLKTGKSRWIPRAYLYRFQLHIRNEDPANPFRPGSADFNDFAAADTHLALGLPFNPPPDTPLWHDLNNTHKQPN